MKTTAIAILISLFAVGSASADYQTDISNTLIQADRDTSSVSFDSMAPTAAGRSQNSSEHSQLQVPEHG